MAQLSTAVSDLVLAVTAFSVSLLTLSSNSLFSLGMSLQGLAASVGVLKFGQSQPSGWVVKAHHALAWITTVVGLALMSSGVHFNQGSTRLAQGLLITTAVFTLSVKFMAADTKTLLTKSLSGFSLLSLLFLFVINWNMFGITACALYILSGSAVGSSGYWSGIPRVDILHYGLALGNLSFQWASL
ncbi:uncharacterized protein LOC135474947 [Liolophura sinensis]|uniref:uncharacterized protein LOC135474947 n=1 Tax=Liolophura sinensis TaxID=3198878 RepID=UPI0031580786